MDAHFFFRQMGSAYALPIAIGAASLIPIDLLIGILFNPHGGLGLILLLLSFPWLLFRVLWLLLAGDSETWSQRYRAATVILVIYPIVSVLSAGIITWSLSVRYGANADLKGYLEFFYFPINFLWHV